MCPPVSNMVVEAAASGNVMLRVDLWSLAPVRMVLMANAVVLYGRRARSARLVDEDQQPIKGHGLMLGIEKGGTAMAPAFQP